jgi:hypothetical protein
MRDAGQSLLHEAFHAISALMECHSRVADALAAGETAAAADFKLLAAAVRMCAERPRGRLH